VFLLKDSSKTEMILTQNLQVQLNQKLKMMMQKMCKMMHIVVQVENKMLPSRKSMMMLKKMIKISKKHQYQIVHQQLHSDGPTETVFLTLGMHQINMWCYCLMVQNLSAFQRQ
jgi:hypothetical protein